MKTQNNKFGQFVRKRRMELASTRREYSIRQLAKRIGIEPSYLSKIERGKQPPPGERPIRSLAIELGEEPDVLLAMAGKVSGDLLEIIRKHPVAAARFLRQLS